MNFDPNRRVEVTGPDGATGRGRIMSFYGLTTEGTKLWMIQLDSGGQAPVPEACMRLLCQVCGGTGREIRAYDVRPGALPPDHPDHPCPECGGTGFAALAQNE